MAKRWDHRSKARLHDVAEDVVRRIYATVQTAKKQGLYGGYAADLLERNVGRRLTGHELVIWRLAKQHLEYDPPGGYQGPKPTGVAKEPPRPNWSYDDPKARDADRMVSCADRRIDEVIKRGKSWAPFDPTKDREILRSAADDLAVAADAYEELGAKIRAGTLRERAEHARRGNHNFLTSYRSHETKKSKTKHSASTRARPSPARLDREIASFLGTGTKSTRLRPPRR